MKQIRDKYHQFCYFTVINRGVFGLVLSFYNIVCDNIGNEAEGWQYKETEILLVK